VIDASQAARLGIKPEKSSAKTLPLQWTLEGV